MNTEKDFRIIKTFKFKNNIYYLLKAFDGDTFFLKDVNGSYDYLEWDEYIRFNNVFNATKNKNILFSNDSEDKIYSVTFENTNTKRKKKVKTAKYVWYKKILIPVGILVLSLGLLKPALDLNTYIFDQSLDNSIINKYGISSSYNFEYFNDDTSITMYFIDAVDNSKFPLCSKILNKDYFESNYSIIDKESFCKQNNLTQPSYDELCNLIRDNDTLESSDKNLFIEFINILENEYPSMDLRLFYYNLKNITIEYKYWNSFDIGNNILSLNSSTNNEINYNYSSHRIYLFHELYHLINNAHNLNNSTYCKDFYDCFLKGNSENFVSVDGGKIFEEYKADLFNTSITNRKFDIEYDYLNTDFLFTIFDSLIYNNKMINYSYRDILDDLKNNCNDKCFNYFVDASFNAEYYVEDGITEFFRSIVETLINRGISIEEIKSRFERLPIVLNNKFTLNKVGDNIFFKEYYEEEYYDMPVYAEDEFGYVIIDENGNPVIDHMETVKNENIDMGYNLTEALNLIYKELDERNNSINR